MYETYSYAGAVRQYGVARTTCFRASTRARSEREAYRNILHQYKQSRGFSKDAGGFVLTGKIMKSSETAM